jgi:hypothetical protein
MLAIGITLTQPYFAFGAGQSSRIQEQPSFSRFVDRLQIFGVDGLGDQPVIIIQQIQPAPTTEPVEPAENRIYVQPRWVDGGYGVQVLKPGYWTEPKQTTER